MVGCACSTIRIVHADMALTRSKAKATQLLKFGKFKKIALFKVCLLRHFGVELKTDG